MDKVEQKISTDELDQALIPLWKAVDQLEAAWRDKVLTSRLNDAADLLREATDMAVSVIQNPEGDIDDARGALTNRLKALLEDSRVARLRPSATFVQAELNAVHSGLELPETTRVPFDVALLALQPEDTIGDRVYKIWRRLRQKIRPIRIASIGRAHLHVGLPMQTALVHGFEISALTVQFLRKLWEVFLQEYTALDEREADCQAIEQVCEEALNVLMERGEVAEKELAIRFESVRAELDKALNRIEAPWVVPIRSARFHLGWFRLQKKYKSLETDWARLYRGMVGSFDLRLEIASFEHQSTEYAEQIRENISIQIKSALLEPLTWMQDHCAADVQDVRKYFGDLRKNTEGQEPKAFARAIDDLQEQLEKQVNALSSGYSISTMSPIDRGRVAMQGRGEMAHASEHLMRQVGGDCDFWVGEPPTWTLGDSPPDREILEVPVRELVRPLVENEVQPELNDLQKRLGNLFVSTQAALRDVWKIIRFNVESGIAELELDAADPGQLLNTAEEIVTGGLERAGTRVGELITEAETVTKDIDDAVTDVLKNAADKVEKNLQPGSELDVRLRQFTRLARSRAEGYAEVGEGVGAAIHARWRYLKRVVGTAFSALVSYIRGLLGLTPVAQQEAQETIDEADLGTVELTRLSPIYRRLFRLAPLQTDDFLVARNDELNTIRQALARWESHRPSALAVVGEVGTGKTTLLNCATPKLFHRYPVYHHAFEETVNTESELAHILCSAIGMEKTDSLSDVSEHLTTRDQPCVVILDHGYELFMRCIGGMEIIRAFLQLLSATSHHVFWCLSITEAAWRYLDAVVKISEYFPYVIETRNMPAGELEQAIMARHEVSGYGIEFLSGESPSLSRRLQRAKDEKERQDILRHSFFEQLSDASKGNVQIALFYWLRSIKEIQNDVVCVEALKPLRFAFLNTLDADKLFTLAAMLQHGTLTVDEHKTIFRSSQAVSQGMLDTLASSNIIQIKSRETDGGEIRYTINPVMRRPVVDLLWNRNIFY